MRIRKNTARAALVLFAALASLPLSAAQTVVKPIADGVRLVQEVETNTANPLVISAVKIDPKQPGIAVKAALAKDVVWLPDATKGREIVSSLTGRTGALVAVNADFFSDSGDPLGLAIVDAELVSDPFAGRAVFGFTTDGKAVFDNLTSDMSVSTASGSVRNINGINRARGQNELILFSSKFGPSTNTAKGTNPVEVVLTSPDLPIKANKPIVATVQTVQSGNNITVPTNGLILSGAGTAADWLGANLKPGDTLTLNLNLISSNGVDWSTVAQAVGGGPWLVKDKQLHITYAEEKFAKSYTIRHPRTAVGVTSTGELLLVTIDGRQKISRGVTFTEEAAIMQRLGAVNAMNLDGGGSSTLSVRGVVANSPCEGKERPVASMLVVNGPVKPETQTIKFADSNLEAISGQPVRPTLVDGATGQPLDPKVAQNVIWGESGGIGFVSQEGRFVPMKAPLSGTIVAILGESKAELPVTVKPSAPAKIDVTFEADASTGVNRNQIVVKLTDANGNVVPNYGFKLSGKNAQLDSPLGQTDDTGKGTVGVTWDAEGGGSVTVTVGSVSTTFNQPAQPTQTQDLMVPPAH